MVIRFLLLWVSVAGLPGDRHPHFAKLVIYCLKTKPLGQFIFCDAFVSYRTFRRIWFIAL